MDTKSLVVPQTPMNIRSKGKLMLGNKAIPLDDTIETFVRARKKTYKEVKYKDNYKPDEFKEPLEKTSPRKSARLEEPKPRDLPKVEQPKLRRSARFKANFTKWEPSRITKAMLSTQSGNTLLPSSFHATSNAPKEVEQVPATQVIELDTSDKLEELRAYHAQLDLQSSIDNPNQSDVNWQIEKIEAWEMRKDRGENRVFLKAVWFGGRSEEH